MRTCLRTVLGAVALAAVAIALCPFSAWARGDPPLPTIGDPAPPTKESLPTIGGPSINNALPNPKPSTGDYRFADGEDPIIVLKPVGETLPDSGKNDFLTVPGKDEPRV